MANGLYQDKSVSSATGASQTIAEQNNARRELVIHNIAASSWTFNPTGGTAVAATGGNITLTAGSTIVLSGTNKITGIGTAAAKLTVLER